MATDCLFREDSYLKECAARVVAISEQGGIVLDRTVFYAASGGQPGDSGALIGADGTRVPITTAVFIDAAKSEIAHLPAPGAPAHTPALAAGDTVTGGSVAETESRLDFDIPEAGLDKDAITAQVNEMIATSAAVRSRWITDAELEANPGLVKTMSVKPPLGTGRVRLIEIANLDLQPCGGTHVRSTAEIGPVRVTQIEKKGKQNRRVRLALV